MVRYSKSFLLMVAIGKLDPAQRRKHIELLFLYYLIPSTLLILGVMSLQTREKRDQGIRSREKTTGRQLYDSPAIKPGHYSVRERVDVYAIAIFRFLPIGPLANCLFSPCLATPTNPKIEKQRICFLFLSKNGGDSYRAPRISSHLCLPQSLFLFFFFYFAACTKSLNCPSEPLFEGILYSACCFQMAQR